MVNAGGNSCRWEMWPLGHRVIDLTSSAAPATVPDTFAPRNTFPRCPVTVWVHRTPLTAMAGTLAHTTREVTELPMKTVCLC
ncbi:hypothetical protein E2C01_072462 [Portunus trituberculatus]|uniref:Uncharacterized protein n=1 Tax=Portunus trituberculatus TaxID=210409 RepID=A0A5B7I2N9_PORTR|nr:hypothetical protein [Portunus trituberculatus]